MLCLSRLTYAVVKVLLNTKPSPRSRQMIAELSIRSTNPLNALTQDKKHLDLALIAGMI